jgi:RimJ/RimL family protein N-acetyltransferase
VTDAHEMIETPRLSLRRWSPGDVALLAAMAVDPNVVRYVGDGRPWPQERSSEVSDRLVRHWDEHGFGWRVAITKDSGETIGLIALNYAGAESGVAGDEFEIGWWLWPRAWGRGLASEGARGLGDEAFTRVAAPSLIARIQAPNAASIGVATNLGMAYEGTSTGRAGEPFSIYRVDRAAWRQRSAAR